MRKKLVFSFLVFLSAWLLSLAGAAFAGDGPDQFGQVEFNTRDRILIMAPHPDDEVLGCAGVIQKAKALGLPVKIVFFTYGDNNEWAFLLYRKHPVIMPKAMQGMGLMRHGEAIAAAKEMGVSESDLIFLGYPDFGTYNIWLWHWGNEPPYKSMLTKTTRVPYSNAFRPGAAYKGEDVLNDIQSVLSDFRPTRIFISHPGDHNGDHRTLYLFTSVALWNLKKEMDPRLYPYLVHFKRWPLPRGYHPQRVLRPPDFFKEDVNWASEYLGEHETAKKDTAIKKHASQYRASGAYLASFVGSNELFGDFHPLSLKIGASPVSLPDEFPGNEVASDEDQVDSQRAWILGIEKRYAQAEPNGIVLSTSFTRPLVKSLGVSVFAYGYRYDQPFQDMPKIHVRIGPNGYSVYNGREKVANESIHVVKRPKEIIVFIPWKLLGDPQKVMTSSTSYIAEVPVDWVAWRTFEISRAE